MRNGFKRLVIAFITGIVAFMGFLCICSYFTNLFFIELSTMSFSESMSIGLALGCMSIWIMNIIIKDELKGDE